MFTPSKLAQQPTAAVHRVAALSAAVGPTDVVLIRAPFGHISPAMMAVYSHVRRMALDEAAKALEPDDVGAPEAVNPPMADEGGSVTGAATGVEASAEDVSAGAGAVCIPVLVGSVVKPGGHWRNLLDRDAVACAFAALGAPS